MILLGTDDKGQKARKRSRYTNGWGMGSKTYRAVREEWAADCWAEDHPQHVQVNSYGLLLWAHTSYFIFPPT